MHDREPWHMVAAILPPKGPTIENRANVITGRDTDILR